MWNPWWGRWGQNDLDKTPQIIDSKENSSNFGGDQTSDSICPEVVLCVNKPVYISCASHKTFDDDEQRALIHERGLRNTRPIRVIVLCEKSERRFAKRVLEALTGIRIEAVCPDCEVDEMIFCLQSSWNVVCPILSTSFQDSVECEKILTFADMLGMPIIPLVVDEDVTSENWLQSLCEGKRIIQIGRHDDFTFNSKIASLAAHLAHQQFPNQSLERSFLCRARDVKGHYRHDLLRFSLCFSFFSMVNQFVGGHGQDAFGAFIIIGSYNATNIEFRKQYLRKGSIEFAGTLNMRKGAVSIKGSWNIDTERGNFCLDVPLKQAVDHRRPMRGHVMLSHHPDDNVMVQKVANRLRSKGLSVWRTANHADIDHALADGVRGAAAVVVFISRAYMASPKAQKELTYAAHLAVPLVAVRTDGIDLTCEQSWLTSIITPLQLQALDLQSPGQADGTTRALHAALARVVPCVGRGRGRNDCRGAGDEVLFEGGASAGSRTYSGVWRPMDIDFITLRCGQVLGHGEDDRGAYVVGGVYGDEGRVWFAKEYVAQHQEVFEGILMPVGPRRCVVMGRWIACVSRLDEPESFTMLLEGGERATIRAAPALV